MKHPRKACCTCANMGSHGYDKMIECLGEIGKGIPNQYALYEPAKHNACIGCPENPHKDGWQCKDANNTTTA